MARSRFVWLFVAAVVLNFAAMGGPRIVAAATQTPVPTAQPPRLDTLEATLSLVRRGVSQPPLLVVDAANVRPAHEHMVEVAVMSGGGWSSNGGPPPQPSPAPVLVPGRDGTLALRDVAAFFGRRIAPVGSVSVLAPATMVVLNGRLPGKPDLFAGLNRAERLQMLLAALTPGQWRKLGSANGLGAGDFSPPAQRDLFLSLLPDPFRVRRQVMTTSDDGKFRYPQPDENLATLSPGQRASTRLTLARRTTLYVPLPLTPEQERSSPEQRSFGTVDTRRELPDGAAFLETASDNASQFAGGTRTLAYGVLLRQEVPARAKPGELAFESARLNPPVTPESGKTVGDLVKLAGTACRLELYADTRLAVLPVTIIGDGAIRSGDVLRALSLAVTGAFRKVSSDGETVYVLSDDVEGLGTRQARLTAWSRAAAARANAEARKLRQQIAAQKPDQYVAFAPGDPHALPDALVQKIAATPADKSVNAGYRPAGVGVNLSDLPPDYQRIARERVASGLGPNMGTGDVGIRPGQVGVQVKARLAFVVPGTGVVEDAGGGLNDNVPDDLQGLWRDESAVLAAQAVAAAPPPASPADLSRLPASVSARAVIVRTAEPAQAVALVEEAARRGLNHLWLALPDVSTAGDEPSRALLAAAIQAGTKNNVAVSAVVPLLRTGPNAAAAAPPEADDPLDRNIQGETSRPAARRQAALIDLEEDEPWRRSQREKLNRAGDLLRVDLPENASRLQSRLTSLAATPGLSGLVFEETAAPGYADPNGVDLSQFGFGEPGGFGYTPALRLRFLRQASLDPIDLGDGRSNRPLELPFFPAEYGIYGHRNTSLGSGGVSATTTMFSTGGGQAPEASPGKAWGLLRHEVNRRFLADLYATLRTARPDLPLFLAEGSETPFWFSRWERANALPYYSWAYSEAGQPPAPPQQARRVSSENLLRIAPDPGGNRRLPDFYLRDLLAALKDWNGVVFDLRDLPADDAFALLRSAFVAAKPPVAPRRD